MKTIFLFLTLVFFSLNLVPQNNDSYFDVANKSIKKYNPSRKDYVIVIDYSKSIFSETVFLGSYSESTGLAAARIEVLAFS